MRPLLRQSATRLCRARPDLSRSSLARPKILPAIPSNARRLKSSISTDSPPPPPNPSTSVNASEISHFDALASTWWDPHGSSRVLHLMNPLRHDFIRSCLASHPSSSSPSDQPQRHLRYLDVGCGGGIFAESAARLPTTQSVTAIDPSAEILSVARRHAARDPALVDRLEYLHATIETLPEMLGAKSPVAQNSGEGQGQKLVEGTYDVVTVFEVVEHVDNPSAFLERCGQFVRPGGWLILSTIARTWTSWFTTNLVAEDILGMVPKGTHDWRKYINEDELRGHFARLPGWGSPRVMGVVYVPGLGWKEVGGSEKIGNYFFGVRREVE